MASAAAEGPSHLQLLPPRRTAATTNTVRRRPLDHRVARTAPKTTTGSLTLFSSPRAFWPLAYVSRNKKKTCRLHSSRLRRRCWLASIIKGGAARVRVQARERWRRHRGSSLNAHKRRGRRSVGAHVRPRSCDARLKKVRAFSRRRRSKSRNPPTRARVPRRGGASWHQLDPAC